MSMLFRRFTLCAAFIMAIGVGPAFSATTQSGIDTPANISYLPFSIQGTQIMNLAGNGLGIGIGTSAPLASLDVNSSSLSNYTAINSRIAFGVWAYAVTLGGTNIGGIHANSGVLTFQGISNANLAIISGNGLVGIGTSSPAYPLDIAGATVRIGAGGAGTLKLNGSTVYDTGNYLHLGSASTTADGSLTVTNNLTVSGTGGITAGAYFHSSDRRLKNDIHPISHALDKLLAIKGVQFSWKQDGRADMGVVAQNVAEVFPDVVSTNKDGMMAVEYDSLVGPMIEAIRELKNQNDDLRDQIAGMSEMKAQLSEIRSTLKDLKTENQQLKSISTEKSLNPHPSASIDH